MEDFQQRVMDEEKELAEKVRRLKAFITSNAKYNTLPEGEKRRLSEQLKAMFKYLDILRLRIAHFGHPG